jgi:hypothetical protein
VTRREQTRERRGRLPLPLSVPPRRHSRTWSEAFFTAAQTGHTSAPASHARHRHRCRHGRTSTHASPPQALHDGDEPVDTGSDGDASKQQDCASSASPHSLPPPPAMAGCWSTLSSVARRPAATASWLLATPSHAWPSPASCRSLSSSSAPRRRARSSSASAARSRASAARPTAATTLRACRRRASWSAARILSVCSVRCGKKKDQRHRVRRRTCMYQYHPTPKPRSRSPDRRIYCDATHAPRPAPARRPPRPGGTAATGRHWPPPSGRW